MRLSLIVLFTSFISLLVLAEEKPLSNSETIQNVQFEVTHLQGSWIPLGDDQYMKSITIKYKSKDGSSDSSDLRDAVARSAEEKCRQLGATDRPEGIEKAESGAALKLSAEVSSKEITFPNKQLSGKYVCGLSLKP